MLDNISNDSIFKSKPKDFVEREQNNYYILVNYFRKSDSDTFVPFLVAHGYDLESIYSSYVSGNSNNCKNYEPEQLYGELRIYQLPKGKDINELSLDSLVELLIGDYVIFDKIQYEMFEKITYPEYIAYRDFKGGSYPIGKELLKSFEPSLFYGIKVYDGFISKFKIRDLHPVFIFAAYNHYAQCYCMGLTDQIPQEESEYATYENGFFWRLFKEDI